MTSTNVKLLVAVVAGVVAAVLVNQAVKAWLQWPETAEAIAAGVAGTLTGLAVHKMFDPVG